MTERRKKSDDVDAPVLTPARKRRRLEGLAYWIVYVPAVTVAVLLARLFVDVVEERLFNEDAA